MNQYGRIVYIFIFAVLW